MCVRFQPGVLVCGGGGGLRDPPAALLQLPARHEPRYAADGRRHPPSLPPRGPGRAHHGVGSYSADYLLTQAFISATASTRDNTKQSLTRRLVNFFTGAKEQK